MQFFDLKGSGNGNAIFPLQPLQDQNFISKRPLFVNFLRKRNDIIVLPFSAQSPIYSHTNATLQGLSTVRAFNAQKVLESEFYDHYDCSTGAFHLKLTTARAFAFWLDVVCLFYIAFVTFSFIIIDDPNGE